MDVGLFGKKIWTGVKGGVMVAVFLFSMGLGCGTTKAIPENAFIVIDEKAGLYMNPLCAIEYYENVDDLVFTTRAEQPKGLNPHPACRDAGGLATDGRSVSMAILEAVGIISPLPSRWNDDGTWNW